MPAMLPEEIRLRKMISDQVSPLVSRVNKLEKEVRRLKSENQSLKNQIARKK